MILGIETSELLCSVAYVKNDRILAEYNHELPKQHASLVGTLIENGGKFISANKLACQNFMDDLEVVAVSIGPGSFTGLRIGLSYAQGLCLGQNIPIVGVNNHQVLAEHCPYGFNSVLTLIDARQDEVYFAKMVRSNTYFQLEDHHIVNKKNLPDVIEENSVLILGAETSLDEPTMKGLLKMRSVIVHTTRYSAALVAKIGWQIYQNKGADNLAELEPLYIRPFAGVQ